MASVPRASARLTIGCAIGCAIAAIADPCEQAPDAIRAK